MNRHVVGTFGLVALGMCASVGPAFAAENVVELQQESGGRTVELNHAQIDELVELRTSARADVGATWDELNALDVLFREYVVRGGRFDPLHALVVRSASLGCRNRCLVAAVTEAIDAMRSGLSDREAQVLVTRSLPRPDRIGEPDERRADHVRAAAARLIATRTARRSPLAAHGRENE